MIRKERRGREEKYREERIPLSQEPFRGRASID